jgi:hypothetical protein
MPPTPDFRPADRLLVVTIDRLPAWLLSAWGSTWVATPAIDSLAARGIVFDRVLTPRIDPRASVRDLLGAGEHSILARAASAGRRVAVVSDQPAAVEAVGLGPAVDVTLHAAARPPGLAGDAGATNLGRLFASASRVLRERLPEILWVHGGCLGIAWDAPLDLRREYLDPDDPAPPPGPDVPDVAVDAGMDPDMLVSLRHVFAAQVTLLDRSLGRLLEEVEPDRAVLVAGVRGLPLGLHDWMGGSGLGADERLPYGESIHVPAIIVDAAGRMAGQRYGGLAIPADLGATAAELAGVTGHLPRDEPWQGRSFAELFAAWRHAPRDRVVVRAAGGDALVTPGWHLIVGAGGETGRRPLLFAKPDDYFERNDVADRCGGVVEELASALAASRGPHGQDADGAWSAPLSTTARDGL